MISKLLVKAELKINFHGIAPGWDLIYSIISSLETDIRYDNVHSPQAIVDNGVHPIIELGDQEYWHNLFQIRVVDQESCVVPGLYDPVH